MSSQQPNTLGQRDHKMSELRPGTLPTLSNSFPAVESQTRTTALPIRSTSVRLSVPLDEDAGTRDLSKSEVTSTTPPIQRRLMRRDSLERREALLKGKEGSRQRRRWENDRLLSNPWAVPPLPSDWQIQPTYPTRTVPYYLAPLWDAAEFQRAVQAKLDSRHHRHRSSSEASSRYSNKLTGMSPMEEAATHIPKEVRARLKHARSAKGLLRDLEEVVRSFVKDWNEKERELLLKQEGNLGLDKDSRLYSSAIESDEDEEIVFSGRKISSSPRFAEQVSSVSPKSEQTYLDMEIETADPTAHKEQGEKAEEIPSIIHEKLMLTALDGDKSASFARWLVHSLGAYYGLRSWSVTTEKEAFIPGDPEGRSKLERRRDAYIGVDMRARGFRDRGGVGKSKHAIWSTNANGDIELPQPLWGMV